ncbi:MAG TPA: tRNA (adenosine(37)-N6)-threonylcarbamoyltransferase complex ATPase subunit type 1 TsaE [Acidimicrobiia bacterium]|nr:tRNA (adenosine(37)-N6)-threonylcarbamoyltransferase complex ATPase subunit type 1 TsaE [Acidimicrobiia bacterium]
MIVRTTSAEQTRAVGAAIATCVRPGTAVLLSGDLGSGKTTIAQGIAAGLGVKEPVVSPTFAIVREYEGDVRVAHVDVYRLERMQELHDLGFEEIVDGDRVVLLEWAELVMPVVGAGGDRIVVRLGAPDDGDDDDVRTIDVHAPHDRALDERLTLAVNATDLPRQAR